MEPPPAVARIYKFDELFISMFRITLIQRVSLDSKFELRSAKFMYFLVVIIVLATTTVLVSAYCMYKRENLTDVIRNGGVVGASVLIVFRAIVLVINRDVLKSLLSTQERLFPVSTEDQLEYNLRKNIKPVILRNKIMSLLLSWMVLAYLIMPQLQSSFNCLIRGQKYSFTYPFMNYFPIAEDQLVCYVFIYCFQGYGSAIATLVYFYEDMLFSILVSQLCMHYKFLCQSLSQLDAKKESESCQKLRKLIKFQNALTLIRDDIDMIFSINTYFTFTVMKVVACLFLFSVVDASRKDLTDLLPYTLTIIAIAISVYKRCSLGTDVYDNSANLINSIYDSNWYEGTPRYRRILIIMMIKANRPIELHASPIKRIDVEYFKEVAIQTYQFMMFLINFAK